MVHFIRELSSPLDITPSVLYNETIHFVNGGITNAHNDLWLHFQALKCCTQRRCPLSKKTPKQIKALGYTKTLSIFVFIVVVEVILFAEYEMHRLRDLTALYVLIGATVTTGFAYFIGLLNKHAKKTQRAGLFTKQLC